MAGKAEKTAKPVPVRTPPKHGTFAPESGPSGDVVVDADAPGPGAVAEPVPDDPKVAKALAKAQKTAEDSGSDRDVKVRATQRGFMGNKVREEGDVFILQLSEGQKVPSWVTAVTDDVPTTPVSHSSEAKEEVVDSAGIGHTAESTLKGK